MVWVAFAGCVSLLFLFVGVLCSLFFLFVGSPCLLFLLFCGVEGVVCSAVFAAGGVRLGCCVVLFRWFWAVNRRRQGVVVL